MELTNELKDLLIAHEMASYTDFVSEDEIEYYDESFLEASYEDIDRIAKEFDGWGMDDLENKILNILKQLVKI